MTSPLRKQLEKEAGWEEFRMIIPHPFLPPRFQKLAKNRNMVLAFDQELTLHVRWEGARFHEHHPLTPRATQRLVREVLNRITKYRRELQVFSRFVVSVGEQPFEELRALDPAPRKKQEEPSAVREEEDEPIEIQTEIAIEAALRAEMLLGVGGESPMPGIEEFYE